MIVLPVVMLGLVPREVFPAAGWASDVLPFGHAVRLFAATLFDVHPWRAIAREAAWLIAVCLAFAALARVAMRRLVA
jgi:hypothetical protein